MKDLAAEVQFSPILLQKFQNIQKVEEFYSEDQYTFYHYHRDFTVLVLSHVRYILMVSETQTGPAEKMNVCSGLGKVEDGFPGGQPPEICLHILAQSSSTLYPG